MAWNSATDLLALFAHLFFGFFQDLLLILNMCLWILIVSVCVSGGQTHQISLELELEVFLRWVLGIEL